MSNIEEEKENELNKLKEEWMKEEGKIFDKYDNKGVVFNAKMCKEQHEIQEKYMKKLEKIKEKYK